MPAQAVGRMVGEISKELLVNYGPEVAGFVADNADVIAEFIAENGPELVEFAADNASEAAEFVADRGPEVAEFVTKHGANAVGVLTDLATRPMLVETALFTAVGSALGNVAKRFVKLVES